MNYQLSSTSGNGSFDLLDAQRNLLSAFHYKNWFSGTGSGSIGDNQLTIKPRNFWYSAFDILINGTSRGDITVNWQGNMLVRLADEHGLTTNYRLKTKGFWHWHFVLENEQHTVLLQLKPTFLWNKMGYTYAVELAEPFTAGTGQQELLLMLICGYGANLYMIMSTGGTS